MGHFSSAFHAHVVQRLFHEVVHAKVEQVVVQQWTNKELKREVVDLLLVEVVGARCGSTCLLCDERSEYVKTLAIVDVEDVFAKQGMAKLTILARELLLAAENCIRHCLFSFTPVTNLSVWYQRVANDSKPPRMRAC